MSQLFPFNITQVTREILEEILENKLNEKLKPICESMIALKDSLEFLSDKYDSVDKRVEELEEKYLRIIRENKFLTVEVSRLSESLNHVSAEMDNMNQYGRRECCKISGLPVEPSEDTNDLIIKVGSLMGVELKESDISVSHRLPSTNNSYSSRVREGVHGHASGKSSDPALRFPKVIVKFVRRETKDLFSGGRKYLKGKSTKDLGLSRISENSIYVSESLSPRNKEIFNDCLKFRRDNHFKHIWTQEGRIYLRKNNDTPARRIACKDDLDKLLPAR
jgi:hypothetical protein